MRRQLISSFAALALVTGTGSLATAGGWAVTTLDDLPASFAPGQGYDIGYTIRQHGVTPVHLEDTAILATAPSGKALSFPGRAEGKVGHHVARVTFPQAGEWRWGVVQGWFGPQDLGVIAVGGAPLAAREAAPIAPAPLVRQAPANGTAMNGLVITGILLTLAGAATIFGIRLAAATRPERQPISSSFVGTPRSTSTRPSASRAG